MKTVMTLLVVLSAAAASAQTQPAQKPPAVTPTTVAGSATSGVQQVDNNTGSSKLTEYRDLRDEFYLPRLRFSASRSDTFFRLSAVNVSRRDQTIRLDTGRANAWNVFADWVEVPHNFSNKAVTPYIERRPGLLEVPATVPITFKKLATSAPDTGQVLASDDLIATYQSTFLAPVELRTQTRFGHFGGMWAASDVLQLAVGYDVRDQDGSKASFGPIGDRPPRTLNIALAEPIDYRTNDAKVAAEYKGDGYQVRADYLFSDFANRIDTLQWQNAYTTAAPGATFDTWDRAVSVFGVRPLPPDNRYHNVSTTVGIDVPGDGRVIALAAYGRLEQDETLLPYAYHVDQLAVKTLPRASADASISTRNFTADYVVSPLPRLHLRAFYHRFDLDNDTASSQWQYITSDTSNLNGTASYVNKRVNVAYAWDRDNTGVETTWRLPKRNTVTLGYEREGIGRVHREADTTEHIVRAAWRVRPRRGLSFDARYLHGARDGDGYNNEVTHESYWYALSEANDNNNPKLTFDNHPDMRRYDVSDRSRRQAEFRAHFTPRDTLSLSAFVRYRNDDFDSDVRPEQPLAETTLSDAAAFSPGDQLGLLKDRRTRYGVDLFGQPAPHLSFNAFINYDRGKAFTRGLEFNENNKANPSTVATAELGPWTRASSQWTADTEDRTWSAGLGASIQLRPDRVTLFANYTLSLADVDVLYGGYGVTNWDGMPFPPTHQFAFSTPSTVNENWHVVNLQLEFAIRAATIVAGYTFEDYTLDDWQQGAIGPWVEHVGADTLLRDSSRSFQWGNRLFNLGTYLAPEYTAHIGFLGLRYRF